MTDPTLAITDTEGDARVLRRVYSICQILSAGLLVVYIFGSWILVGGGIAE